MTLHFMTFGVRGVDANLLLGGNQALNGDGGPNELTDANLIGANGIPFQQLLLFMGQNNDGDLNIDAGETAFNLSDMASRDRVLSLSTTNDDDPIRISAHGLLSGGALGDLTAAVRFDNERGFGLDNAPDGEIAAHWLNGGDSISFEVTTIGGVKQSLAAVSFVVNLAGSGPENVIVDFDGDAVAAGGGVDGIDLGPVADGTIIALDFGTRTIRIGSVKRAMSDVEFAAFLAGGLDRITIGSLNTSTQGFSIQNLAIASTGALNDGAVIEAPAAGGTTSGTDAGDILVGSSASDALLAGAGADVVFGGAGDDAIDAGAGDDLAEGGEGDDVIVGGEGDDVLIGGGGDDIVTGGTGADRYVVRSLDDLSVNTDHIVDFESGQDLIDLSAVGGLSFIGGDAFTGVAGQVRFEVVGATTEIHIDADGDGVFDDRIIINNGRFNLAETALGSLLLEVRPIVGTEGNDALGGVDEFDERFMGLGGDDVLRGGGGNDLLNGGEGVDTADYSTDTAAVLAFLADGTATGVQAGSDTLVSIENVTGGAGDDTFFGNDDDNLLIGGAGADSIFDGQGDDTLIGGEGNDLLQSTAGADTLIGGAGDDVLYTFNSQGDTLMGGDGNDELLAVAGNATIDGGAGVDWLRLFIGGSTDITMSISSTARVTEFFDNFSRPDGAVGNGWFEPLRDSDRNLSISGGQLTSLGNDGAIHRQIDMSGPVTVSATITHHSRPGGHGNVFNTKFLFGGTVENPEGGYGVQFLSEGHSRVILFGGGTILAEIPASFLFDTSITPTVTFHPDGRIIGSVAGSGQVFEFSFGPQPNFRVGNLFTIVQGAPSPDAPAAIFPTIDNLSIVTSGSHSDGAISDGNQTVTFSNVENLDVHGGPGNDLLLGGNGADALVGNEGDDTLDGGGGVDLIAGGDGVDLVRLNLSNTMYTLTVNMESAAHADDGTTLENGTHLRTVERIDLSTGAGDDALIFGAGFIGSNTWDAGAGYDVLTMDMSGMSDAIKLDHITPTFQNPDRTIGHVGAGAELSYATWATMLNFTGVEMYVLTTGSGIDHLEGGEWADVFTTNAGDDELFGWGGGDVLNGGEGNDRLRGDGGDDTLIGGDGDDTLEGGDGNDTADYSADSAGVNVTLANGIAVAAQIGIDSLSSIENVTGGSGNDTLIGDGGDNRLDGGAGGNDILDGGTGEDTLEGGEGDDTLIGGVDHDVLTGGAGDDTIDGGVGVYNWIDGGEGTDLVRIDMSDATTSLVVDIVSAGGSGGTTLANGTYLRNVERVDLTTGSGDDQLFFGAGFIGQNDWNAGAGFDVLTMDLSAISEAVKLDHLTPDFRNPDRTIGFVGVGVELPPPAPFATFATMLNFTGVDAFHLTTGSGDDHLEGGEGADILTTNGGVDELFGFGGDDVLSGGEGNDRLRGDGGNDTADFSADTAGVIVSLAAGMATGAESGSDTLATIENVTGGAGDDTLIGDGGDNRLAGGEGNDILDGGAGGNDTIDGGEGSDRVTLDFSSSTSDVTMNVTSAGSPATFVETFNRPDGEVGNGWLNATNNPAGGLSIGGGALTATSLGNAAGIHRQIDLSSSPVTVSATLTHYSGFGGHGNVFNTMFMFGGDGTLESGYGVQFLSEGYSRIILFGGGVVLAEVPASFLFDTSIDVLVTLAVDGGISGSVAGNGQVFDFSFGPQPVDRGSGDFAIVQAAPNPNASNYIFPTIDNLSITNTVVHADGAITDGERTTTFSSIESMHIIGGSGNDTLDGVNSNEGGGSDTLDGGAGNDKLIGGRGNDVLIGGDGDDELRGGMGVKWMDGGEGFDLVVLDAQFEAADLNFVASIAASAAGLTMENGTYLRNAEAFQLVTGAGDDTAVFDIGLAADVYQEWLANEGFDRLIVDLSSVTETVRADGGASGNVYWGASGQHSLFYHGVEAFDIAGGGGNDALIGGEYDDVLAGNGGDDTIDGGEGNDTLSGGGGNDTLVGGEGIDTADYSTDIAGVTVSLSSGNAVGTEAGNDDFTSIESATGGIGADVLVAGGDDNTLRGGGGDDFIDGGEGTDIIAGDDGDDTLVSVGGNSTIDGGAGIDLARLDLSQTPSNLVLDMASVGSLEGATPVNGALLRNIERIDLTTGSGDDQLIFGAGFTGQNNWNAGAGFDVLTMDLSATSEAVKLDHVAPTFQNPDRTIGHVGVGVELSYATWATMLNFTWVEMYVLTTGSGIDHLEGGEWGDVFTTNAGDDELFGWGGDDMLNGGAGNDRLLGAEGDDVAVFAGNRAEYIFLGSPDGMTIIDTVAERDGRDNTSSVEFLQFGDALVAAGDLTFTDPVTDFEPGLSTIDLSAIGGLSFIGQNVFTGIAGQVRFAVVAGVTDIQIDADGDGALDNRLVIANGQFNLTETAPGSLVLEAAPILGTADDDSISGTDAFDDRMLGLAGNDFLSGGVGNDTLDGGDGNDDLVDDSGFNKLLGGAGEDLLSINYSSNFIDGGEGLDKLRFYRPDLTQNVTVDVVESGEGNSYAFQLGDGTAVQGVEQIDITTGSGDDTVTFTNIARVPVQSFRGEGGTDTAIVDFSSFSADVTAAFNLDTDTEPYRTDYYFIRTVDHTGRVYLHESVENLVMYGGGGNDLLVRDSGNNMLAGNGGDDTILGGAGVDTIEGGAGDDFLDSGRGGDDSIDGGDGLDTVTLDFSGSTTAVVMGVMSSTASMVEFFDDFNRPDGVVGNGWLDAVENANGDILISGGQLTVPSAGGGIAGLYRPIDLSGSVTVSATITPLDGNGGDPNRFFTSVLIGSAGDMASGYGVAFVRSGDTYNNSMVMLVHAGGQVGADASVAIAPSDFQFDGFITPTVTFFADGGIIGSVVGNNGQVFNFSFEPNPRVIAGENVIITQDYPTNSLFPTIDNVSIVTSTYSISGSINDASRSVAFSNVESLRILGGTGNDSLAGGGGSDTLAGGAGDDALYGGEGADTADYSADSGGVIASLEDGTALGTSTGVDALSSIENITGGLGNDTLIGSGSFNVLTGGDGDDILDGGGGADIIDGGDGVDLARLDLAGATSGVTLDVAIAGGGDGITLQNGGHVRNIERIDLTTGSGDDALIFGAGFTGRNNWDAGAGFDVLTMDLSGMSDAIKLDHVTPTFQNPDRTIGHVGVGAELSYATWATMLNFTGVEMYVLTTGSGIDHLEGGEWGDVFTTNAGDDELFGWGGDDVLSGGAGNDRLRGDGGNDTADFSTDTAGVTASLAAGTATGAESGNDTLVAIENITGGAGTDTLTGDGGANMLAGGAGDDVLDGGAGADDLEGGDGADTFLFVAGEADADMIRDFSAGDLIRFEGYGAAAEGASLVQVDATHWQITSADGLMVDVITLANGSSIDPSDYIFGGG